MSREGVNEVIPGLLYQRGNFLTWPASRKWAMLNRHGIRVVVNLWSKVDPDLSVERPGLVYLNWHISGTEPPAEAAYVISMLANLARRGMPILVHCEAGVNRSAWLCARLVHALDPSLTGSQALQEVYNALPGVRMRSGLQEDIERL